MQLQKVQDFSRGEGQIHWPFASEKGSMHWWGLKWGAVETEIGSHSPVTDCVVS